MMLQRVALRVSLWFPPLSHRLTRKWPILPFVGPENHGFEMSKQPIASTPMQWLDWVNTRALKRALTSIDIVLVWLYYMGAWVCCCILEIVLSSTFYITVLKWGLGSHICRAAWLHEWMHQQMWFLAYWNTGNMTEVFHCQICLFYELNIFYNYNFYLLINHWVLFWYLISIGLNLVNVSLSLKYKFFFF